MRISTILLALCFSTACGSSQNKSSPGTTSGTTGGGSTTSATTTGGGSSGTTTGTNTGGTGGTGGTPFVLQVHAPGCVPWAPMPEVGGNVTLTPVAASLTASLSEADGLAQAPGDDSTWYVIEQFGRLSSFPAGDGVGAGQRHTVLDITSSVYSDNEAGMLGIAIDPNFATNRQIYLAYTTVQPANNNAYILNVGRITLGSNGNATTALPTVVFAINEPFNYHIGGHINFGPDGFLYIGTGMADTSNNPSGTAQNLGSIYGKVLRIDVSASQPQTFGHYGIPAGNPFTTNRAALPEIYAYGFRNPWQFNFDRGTGDLWVGDVGQDAWEEIDVVDAGANYGWGYYEGPVCNPNYWDYRGGAGCSGITAVAPKYSYNHDGSTPAYGDCIIGGFVYRGTDLPGLDGALVFSDCVTGTIWALLADANGNPNAFATLGQANAGVLSFTQDNHGEIYFVDRASGITRIDPAGVTTSSQVPPSLTATGCFDNPNSMTPVAGVVPYTVDVAFWSDGADKTRFVSVPQNATMSIDANAHITLPIGTILVKNFSHGGMPVETRIYARQQDGTWSPYTYAWHGGNTTLVPATGLDVLLDDGVTWHYPSQAQCHNCHNGASGYNLGWQVGQINTLQDYGDGMPVNQLQTYAKYGLLSGSIPATPAFVLPTDASQSLQARARSYLHVNCSICHQPGGQGLGTLDFRITTAVSQMGMCNVTPSFGDFGVANAALLVPGHHAESMLSYRMHVTGASRMPNVSSNVVDVQGTALVDAWIDSLSVCPQ